MKRNAYFFVIIVCLAVLDAVLLSSPNFLGKLGLFIYKYSYLRTFPKTLLTVSIAVVIAMLIAAFIRLLVKKQIIKRSLGLVLLWIFVAVSAAALVKTVLDFSAWSYAHTGMRFRFGAYLLPGILLLIFGYQIFNLPKVSATLKVSDTLTP